MRSLTTRARLLATTALVFGALAAPAHAATYCAWDGVAYGAYDNMVALAGSQCQVTASGISFQAGQNPPALPGPPPPLYIDTGIPYTGFAFIAYEGGSIESDGDNVSITSYPGSFPGEPTAPYGVISDGDSDGTRSSVAFHGTTTVTTTSDSAYGLYATAYDTPTPFRVGGTISSTAAMTVATSGAGASGVVADGGGTVTLSGGGSVTTSGDGSDGVHATGSQSTITATGVAIATSGAGSPGVAADEGGVVTLNGGSVTTTGAGSDGLYVTGASSAITAAGVSITTGASEAPASDSVGVTASNFGTATLDGGSVTTHGASSAGLYASGTGASITGGLREGVGVSVTTTGAGSAGALAGDGGAVALTGGSVTTSGTSAAGLAASGTNGAGTASRIVAQNVAVLTRGASANGVQADGGGSVQLSGGSVTTSGTANAGVYATGLSTAIVADNVAVSASGLSTGADSSNGVTADSRATLTFTGGSVKPGTTAYKPEHVILSQVQVAF